ncbi:MAG: insulinase family protein [Oscillospiraceae bacterium]|jgi:predicted Zn-dependent peptidase|nr:insulinase family protein [Oscillospiraceae bacterium]
MPQLQIHEAAPGVTLCVIPAERFKTSRLVLQMALPLRRGQARETAANAMLPFLLHRSCAAYPTPRALDCKLASLYGANLCAGVTKVGESHQLSIALSMLDDRFALHGEAVSQEGVELLLELLFHPRLEGGLFPADAVELEKRLLLEKLESEQGNKRLYAMHRCEELMCDQEAYGLHALGEAQAIEALTPEDAVQAWRRVLSQARVQISMVSAAETAGFAAAVRKSFAESARQPAALGSAFIKSAQEQKFVREEQPLEQATLVLGFRAGMEHPEDRQYALRLMTDLFGGGPYSKLFLNVREKMSLCYYCRAALVRHKGVLMVASGVDTEKAVTAREAILDQLAQIGSGCFTDEELETAKRSMCDEIRCVADHPESLADWYSSALYCGEFRSPEQVCAGLEAVTRGEIIEAARGVSLDTVYLLAAKKGGDAND